MILDFITLNTTNIILCTVLLNIFHLNYQKTIILLTIDIILNGIPFVTLIIILLYYLNKLIFKYLNNNFVTQYILIIVYYFLFNIILYSIFNKFNMYIINEIINNLIYNAIIFYIGLKYYQNKYNKVGDF